MIHRIIVYAVCDMCKMPFQVAMETADTLSPLQHSLLHLAEDAIREGLGYTDGTQTATGWGSVYHGKHLCCKCTHAAREFEKMIQEDKNAMEHIL